MPKAFALANRLIDAYQEALSPGGWLNWAGRRVGPVGLEVKEFPHGSEGAIQKVRGLALLEDVNEGEEVIVVPPELRVVGRDIRDPRFQATTKGRLSAMALWFAEKRAEAHKAPAILSTDRDKFLRDYIRSLPKWSDYEASGLPLAASDSDIAAIEKLKPFSDTVVHFVNNSKKDVFKNVELYNAARGAHPKISNEDALWGHAVVTTRGFLGWDLPTVVPVGDMLNSGRDGSNVWLEHDPESGSVVFLAKRDLHEGDELTYNYSADDEDSLSMLFKYGVLEDDKQHVERWPEQLCSDLSSARKWEKSDRPLLHHIAQLVRHNCAWAADEAARATALRNPPKDSGEALVRKLNKPDMWGQYTPDRTWRFVPASSIWEPAPPQHDGQEVMQGDEEVEPEINGRVPEENFLAPPRSEANVQKQVQQVKQQALFEQVQLLGPLPCSAPYRNYTKAARGRPCSAHYRNYTKAVWQGYHFL